MAIGVKGAFGVVAALLYDPPTEPVAIDRVGHRDTGITVALDVIQEPAESFLPSVGTGVPGPAGQFLESLLTVGVEGAVGVIPALYVDPLTEPVAIDRVGVQDAGVTVALDIVHESAETLLPQVGVGSHVQPGRSWSRRWWSASSLLRLWRCVLTHSPSR